MIEVDKKLIKLAIAEDLPHGDATHPYLKPGTVEARIVARTPTRVCGQNYAKTAYSMVAKHLNLKAGTYKILIEDGQDVPGGATIAVVRGDIRWVVSGERIALNFLMRMSGIASYCASIRLQTPPHIVLLDTRKTTPGWRVAEKYAFRTGGFTNHRHSLSQGAMLKDNHLESLRKENVPNRGSLDALEIEIDSLAQLDSVLPYRPTSILLDNFTTADARKALELIPEYIFVEISGNADLEQLRTLPDSRPFGVSLGRQLQNANWADLGLDRS